MPNRAKQELVEALEMYRKSDPIVRGCVTETILGVSDSSNKYLISLNQAVTNSNEYPIENQKFRQLRRDVDTLLRLLLPESIIIDQPPVSTAEVLSRNLKFSNGQWLMHVRPDDQRVIDGIIARGGA